MDISSEIKKIVSRRLGTGDYQGRGRLSEIDGRLNNITTIEKKVEELQMMLNSDAYDKCASKAPKMMMHKTEIIAELDQFTNLAAAYRKELERLHERFGRNKVQIAFIGRARQGKSTFLQSITGLSDSTIPSSAGSDCTGAISIIENYTTSKGHDYFEARIEYYTEDEFVVAVNQKLAELFPAKGIRIYATDDIPRLSEREEFHNIPIEQGKVKNFLDVYIKQYNTYKSLLGSADETLRDEERVAEYVAKYKKCRKNASVVKEYRKNYEVVEYSGVELGDYVNVRFCKYVAVKTLHIKKTFRNADAGDIVLVDTIGLGNHDTEKEDKKRMYEVLKHDSDAAVYVYKPNEDGTSQAPSEQISTLEELAVNLAGYSPEKWIVGVINKKSRRNSAKSAEGYAEYLTHLNGQQEQIANQKKCIAWCGVVDGADESDVNDKLVVPLLRTIIENIDDIDNSFMKRAYEMGSEIYRRYYALCKRVETVVGVLMTSDIDVKSIFRDRFKHLPLKAALHKYVEQYYKMIGEPCRYILDDLRPIIDDITQHIPSKESIAQTIADGPHWIGTVYNNMMDFVRSKILRELKDVSSKSIFTLQEKVKTDIASLLYEEGLLGRIKLQSISAQGPSVEWMRALVKEKLYKYPIWSSAIQTVSNFEIRIEGYVYSKCIRACDIMRPNKTQAPEITDASLSPEDMADIIWQRIFNNIQNVKAQLYEELGLRPKSIIHNDNGMVLESLQPNIIMWCMVDTFEQEIRSGEGAEEFERIYEDFCQTLWYNDIMSAAKSSDFMESISALYGEMNSLCDKDRF